MPDMYSMQLRMVCELREHSCLSVQTVWTAVTLIAAVAAALGLAAAAAFLVPAAQEPAPRKTLQPQESLDPHGKPPYLPH